MKKKQTSTSVIIMVNPDQKKELRRIAAQRNLDNPERSETISSVGRDAVELFIHNLSKEYPSDK